MTKEKLKKEAEEYALNQWEGNLPWSVIQKAYFDGAEPREKRIAELEKENKVLAQNLEDSEIIIAGLKTQIEKMKRCEICEHSGTYLPVCYSNEPCKNKDKFELRR